MFKYFTSLFFVLFVATGVAQEQTKDTITYKTSYGLRVGIDISKPILGLIDSKNSGFEIVGDYRFSKNLYIATELGYKNKTSIEDYTNSTAKGSYLKLGVNYNTYKNWLDMNNEVYLGFRYGFSIFDQTLNSYTSNTGSTYFPGELNTNSSTTTGLNAHWTEFVLGLKVETFKNLFLGFSVSYKIMMSLQNPENFKTLYVPGFNRVFESETGFGFNYTISYTIPFVHK
ncbi:MAG: DUF6048 family protein [Polaribacter sp.]|nr:DUF6048 family protein [Polaribacter sp.]